jgi:hypothetical protein
MLLKKDETIVDGTLTREFEDGCFEMTLPTDFIIYVERGLNTNEHMGVGDNVFAKISIHDPYHGVIGIF